ncbi:formate dehydrogenase accessory sulfurtransferase FdhD [Egicoccus sp. AB-alg2]|uniref:formate dehydrogenase accessory sulfurtransferase FdhD n=1 Tax=Egicoccus sp. AB-alg2 TaxID=3242693 RepID=UPI00359CDA99
MSSVRPDDLDPSPSRGRVACTAAVLAGGASRRMGRDKRFVPVAGQPLLARAVAAVAEVTDDVVVVVAEPGPLPALPGHPRTVRDTHPGAGPLGALVTALDDDAEELVLVVAGDHPALAPAVLSMLLERLAPADHLDAVLLGDDAGEAQPLVGAYRRRAAGPLRQAFAAGERRARAVCDHLDVEVVPPAAWRPLDPAGDTLRDLDTPADVSAYARARWPGQDGTGIEVVRLQSSGEGVDRTARGDRLAPEEPLRIRAAGPGQDPVDVVTTMRSPGAEHELALGWLFTEGLYDPRRGAATVTYGDPRELARPEDTVEVRLPHPLDLAAAAHRHTAATASCGVCGRASIDELAARCAPLPADVPARPLAAALLLELPQRLRRSQSLFAGTGGVHATGLFDGDGAAVCVREDVGRHNALDAAIGTRLRDGHLDFSDLVAVLSGRIGFELVAKAAAAGIPVVVAVGAPTDLAVRTAQRLGITLVGFVRAGGGNLYTHPHRVVT